jgi:IPT/TIG domain
VLLNGVPVTINSWSDTSISITLPSGATSGPLAVAVAPSMNSSNPVTFTVAAANYALSASPSNLSVVQGASGTSTITVTPQNGFNGGVSLSASGLPSGVTASFNPNPATATSTLTLTASSTATTGTATVTVTGTSGSLTNAATITLTVTAPNYTLSAAPSSLSVVQGASGTSTITVAPQNGFSGSVSLSASGLPSGVTASFSPNPATTTSTLTLTANSTATTGTVPVTLTGTSGGLTNTTTVTVSVISVPLLTVWQQQDIGQVGQPGSATYASGTFTLKGSGLYIFSTADSGHLVYQPLSGDGTIVARVVSLQGGGSYQEAGVLMRETLNPDSKNVYMAWGAGRPYLAWRSSTAGSTSLQTMSNGSLPSWVKLVRSASTFTGYASSDGVNWVLASSQTVSMNTNIYVALATSAEANNTALGTATLDNVSLSTSGAPAPIISSVSSTTGSIGSQIVITGSGFGASQGNSVVLLNGVPVTINSWSDTSISITIPSGATSGPLAVAVAPSMNSSNPVTFTVTAH